MSKADSKPIKIALVGDATVGKTHLLETYMQKKFAPTYKPNSIDYALEELIKVAVVVDDEPYDVELWFMSGFEKYQAIQVKFYKDTDAFILVYAVDNRSSFNNVPAKWIPDLNQHCPGTPIVFAGAKVDIRKEGSSTGSCVSYEEGLKVGEQFASFIEVSAQTGENIEALFEQAIRLAVEKRKKIQQSKR